MTESAPAPLNGMATRLVETWGDQAASGFLLTPPTNGAIEIRRAADEATGVEFRFRWLPHRELRTDVAELERRGILDPHRRRDRLFRDPRSPAGHHCFLCPANVRESHPLEVLVEIDLAGRSYNAGANFAWIAENHFTVMAAEHLDQEYSRHVVEAMAELHRRTGGAFRVLFNGAGAGATIPWHLHFQITTEPLPVEQLRPGAEIAYPTMVRRFAGPGTFDATDEYIVEWLRRDPRHHSANVLVAGTEARPTVFVFPRDQRRSVATNKGLVGGFEVAGDFAYSEPGQRDNFDTADCHTAREALRQINPAGH